MGKKPTLLDDVLTRATRTQPGYKSWFEMLPPEAQAELEQVRRAFDVTTHQKKAYALAIIEAAKERGWKTSGMQGVIAWLNGKR